ncbi:MAG: hypothetical protein RBR70_10515 [Arcobacter sp.]|jgi:hypothetical protein|uniref:hypothetical protein n=1 Tax=Arcobacter sp. TaxID=1872629 RepID=UPI002A76142F|nr:hypothetical protein [Arcobacter sp.]MDY3205492.1 hypothetical protein [Arcobacter sp.]
MKKSLLIFTFLITSIHAEQNYTTVKNGKIIYIPNQIGFQGIIKNVITIENYKLAKMIDEEGNIIRGRFYKKNDIEVNDTFYINCNTFNGIEYEHCY